MAEGPLEPKELLNTFASSNAHSNVLKKIMCNADPNVVLLALEGLYRINDVQSGQFKSDIVRDFLRRWRCESLVSEAYYEGRIRLPPFLKSLTIFKTLEVPLFIDNYGKKELLSNYDEIESIPINGNTTIFHDTHAAEAEAICNKRQLKPSENKNIIKGCWFGLRSPSSVYGVKRFKTKLSKLGVTGLHQGEVVSYKNEVNVILYAAGDTDFKDLWKPTDEAVKKNNAKAYVHVSIFVPSRFLPHKDQFEDVISGPDDVKHGPICVRALRSFRACTELETSQAMQQQFGKMTLNV